ncbi:myosin-binding protein cardiac-type [Limosa lapponica baueri]|uniref:Myosin-binding protein cardiac-type n=1 Tax=Limosa lapponica baueri TaxID=1758121 RepID=A0A2I0TAK9_LIMLA|nr:myosin-binding protein cardiac-type [Limosa lapponica baueri]
MCTTVLFLLVKSKQLQCDSTPSTSKKEVALNDCRKGKPRPKIIWMKDGQTLDSKDVGIRNSNTDTILFIRKAELHHSGAYEITLQIENMTDKVTITIQIIDKPGPPQNIKLVDVWGFNAALEWTPPQDDGNAQILGYTVQKADKKAMSFKKTAANVMYCSINLNDT